MMDSSSNPTIHALRHLDGRLDSVNAQMDDFMYRQTNGENPDPAEFTRLLEKSETTKSAMQAQFQLLDKPLKTVLTESR
jgi:hypothetical protein